MKELPTLFQSKINDIAVVILILLGYHPKL